MFTLNEKQSRHAAIREVLGTENLQALLLVGDTNAHRAVHGDFGYYTNTFTFAYRQIAVVFASSEPVLFAVSIFQRASDIETSFVSDCRVADNLIEGAAKLLKERHVRTGRIGVSFETLPSSWYLYLKREFPEIEWVEAHEPIMQVRLQRSREEADVYRKGASLADGAFEAAVRCMKPGVSEFEICAEIEYYARARGAQAHFTLIGSGRFEMGSGNTLTFPRPPSPRRIEAGDTVTMEITPRYEGYWTQLLRSVHIARSNSELEKIHKISRDAIKHGLEHFKPGGTLADVDAAITSHVGSRGYVSRQASGHVPGHDLVETRPYQNKAILRPGTAAIIHPQIFTADGNHGCFCCGETYLITEDGYERLTRTGDDLLVV